MRRMLRVYRSFAASSLAREMEFKANFFAKVGQNVVWLGFFVLTLFVVYGRTNSVAGWGKGDAIVLAATTYFLGSIAAGFFFSLTEIPQQVRMGTLDFVLTRPIDSQFWVSLRRVAPEQFGSALIGLGMVVVGLRVGDVHPGLDQWFGWGVLVVCAVLVFYSMNLALMTTGIWFVRVDNLWVLSETVQQVSRFPLDIYGPRLAQVLTFAIPLGLLGTVPSRQLVQGFDATTLVAGIAWALVALIASRLFWRRALRSYGSASG